MLQSKAALACTTQNYWNSSANSQAWNWDECIVGTTINVTNAGWSCDRPLSSYGTLPIKVISTWTTAAPRAQIGIDLRTGCSGDGTSAIDLVVEMRITGSGYVSDPLKTRMVPGPQNIDITGSLNASGPQAVWQDADHQDCIQFQGGSNNNFVNIDGCGDYDAGTSNTQAAGGVAFFSINNSLASIYGGKFIGCNHSLNVHNGAVAPGSRIVNAKFRSGNNTTAWCSQFSASPPCDIEDTDIVLTNISCQRYVNGNWVEQSQNPPPNPPPPPPPNPPPPPPPTPSQPTVTLNANPTTINSGISSTLTWSSTNATSCTSSGAWTGNRPTSGSLSVSPTSTSTYSLACTGAGGTANASRTVTVNPPNPPPPPPSTKPGDVNGDNRVDVTDLSILLSRFGTNYPNADFNKDGTVNVVDLSILLSNYGT